MYVIEKKVIVVEWLCHISSVISFVGSKCYILSQFLFEMYF